MLQESIWELNVLGVLTPPAVWRARSIYGTVRDGRSRITFSHNESMTCVLQVRRKWDIEVASLCSSGSSLKGPTAGRRTTPRLTQLYPCTCSRLIHCFKSESRRCATYLLSCIGAPQWLSPERDGMVDGRWCGIDRSKLSPIEQGHSVRWNQSNGRHKIWKEGKGPIASTLHIISTAIRVGMTDGRRGKATRVYQSTSTGDHL